MLRVCGTIAALLVAQPFVAGSDLLSPVSDDERLVATERPPIAHWTFDEKKGLSAADSSGHRNVGTLHDFSPRETHWVRGRIGGALSFNLTASNNVVRIPDSSLLNFTNQAAFSISVWIRGKDQQVPSSGIVCKGFGTGGEQYALDTLDGRFRFFVRPAGGSPVASIFTWARPDGNWQHLVATYDAAGIMALYSDGRLIGSHSNPPPALLYSAEPVSIGSRELLKGSGFNLPFKGLIDDVRIYDYALTGAEIKKLYSMAGDFPPVLQMRPGNTRSVQKARVVFSAVADGIEPLRYQWLKNGESLAGQTNRSLVITNLLLTDAGGYAVQVTDPQGNTVSASAVLTVTPFFWQTWWFRILLIPILLVSVGLIVHFVEKRKTQRALERMERIHAVDRERMRIARDMHDEIGAKLSRISFLSDLARRSVNGNSLAGRQIDEVSEAAHDIIQTVDEIVWAVNPRNDTLESLVHYICRHAEEFFELTPVELQLDLPGNFPVHQFSAEVRHNLFCATKETLSNALKHAKATKVRISFVVDETFFQIQIKDNGCGFNPPDPLEKTTNDNQTRRRRGSGLLNIRERLRNVQGEAIMESAPGQGSTVLLNVSLKRDEALKGVIRNPK